MLGQGSLEGVCVPCQVEGPLGCLAGKARVWGTPSKECSAVWFRKGKGHIGTAQPLRPAQCQRWGSGKRGPLAAWSENQKKRLLCNLSLIEGD